MAAGLAPGGGPGRGASTALGRDGIRRPLRRTDSAVKSAFRCGPRALELARLSGDSAILAGAMQDFDAEISPEPIRPMYASDREHARAWLAWAEQTPGGWRARLADKLGTSGSIPLTLPPAWAATVGLPGLAPNKADDGTAAPGQQRSEAGGPSVSSRSVGMVRYVEQPSSCCNARVVLDPEPSWARHGICAACGSVLRRGLTGWDVLPPARPED